MADIYHHFPINAPARQVFDAISTPQGLDAWWTKASTGEPGLGARYELDFGPGYEWQAEVTRCSASNTFELKLLKADKDWRDTRVGFDIQEKQGVTQVKFHHTGWPEDNDHYRISCYCWAMYLRILKRHIEYGEQVPYEQRLEV